MTRKQFSVWMLAGCIGAGSTFGATVSAEQLDGEMGYYDTGEGYWDNAYQGDSVQEDTYTTYEDQTYAPQPAEEYYSETEAWTPDSTEYYDSNVVTEEEASEETEADHYYKDDPYISIRKTDRFKKTEDFDILTKEDAERDFDLLSYDELPSSVSLEVPEVRQLPELPTGCESVALTMALEYEGFMLYKTTIAREFLVYNQETDNMAIGYIGDPFSKDGAGCFAPAIAATADNFFEDQGYDYAAYNISGSEMEELLSYVAAGTPVVLWTTMYMAEPEFTEDTTEYDGELYRWYYQEHCVVLSGYDLDNGTLQINDPLEGIVTRDYEEFKSIYDTVGKYAVVVKAASEEQE